MKKIDVRYRRGLKKRDSFVSLKEFIDGDICLDGRIAILYGLRRTGKTTLMEQAFNRDDSAFYLAEKGDTMKDVEDRIIDEMEKGNRVIFFDEITRISDIENCSGLPDIYAKYGMRIILTGTDSLVFNEVEDRLFDRAVRIQTTYIPFTEHCRVLGTRDIDDYISFGGLMRPGERIDRVVYDYESRMKYLDEAVSENIANSLKKDRSSNPLKKLSRNELTVIINKIVELHCGYISIETIRDRIYGTKMNHLIRDRLKDVEEMDVIRRYMPKRDRISSDFLKQINAGGEITSKIDDAMVRNLERMLYEMNLLSVIPEKLFYKVDEAWLSSPEGYASYIIQPAIRYYQLTKALEFIDTHPDMVQLSENTRDYLKRKLDEEIRGEMTEDIILYDTKKMLPSDRYLVLKPTFRIDGISAGEYDMLIYEKEMNRYWAFEIKHTSHPFIGCRDNVYIGQDKHLLNEDFRSVIQNMYGTRMEDCVLYNGSSFESPLGTLYLNISDFMIMLENSPSVEIAFKYLKKGLQKESFDMMHFEGDCEEIKASYEMNDAEAMAEEEFTN